MIGPIVTNPVVGGNMPGVGHAGSRAPQFPSIFFSQREQAMLLSKTVRPGFGFLLPGTLMAVANSDGALVPYIYCADPTIVSGKRIVGKSFLIADLANTTNHITVSYQDSIRFSVGEDIVLMRNNAGAPAYFDGGAITGITYPTTGTAVIAFTNASTDANFTMANFAVAYPKSGVTTKFNKAVYVLDEFLETGLGPVNSNAPTTAIGALASVVIGNALLYSDRLVNLDANAITDLGGTQDGMFFYFK